MSAICKTCRQHKQKVRCPDCRGIWGLFHSSCERCKNTKYILECPNQKSHDFDKKMEELGKRIRSFDKTGHPIPTRTGDNVSGSIRQRPFSMHCNGTGYITEMVKVPNLLTPWPPFRIEKRTVRCPLCNRGY